MPLHAVSQSRPVTYAYLNHKLEDLITCLQNARFLLNNAASKTNNSDTSTPLHQMLQETIVCEQELKTLMHSYFDSCANTMVEQPHHYFPPERYTSLSSVALYCEHVYVEKYMQLLNDCHISPFVKELLQHHTIALKNALQNIESLSGTLQHE